MIDPQTHLKTTTPGSSGHHWSVPGWNYCRETCWPVDNRGQQGRWQKFLRSSIGIDLGRQIVEGLVNEHGLCAKRETCLIRWLNGPLTYATFVPPCNISLCFRLLIFFVPSPQHGLSCCQDSQLWALRQEARPFHGREGQPPGPRCRKQQKQFAVILTLRRCIWQFASLYQSHNRCNMDRTIVSSFFIWAGGQPQNLGG